MEKEIRSALIKASLLGVDNTHLLLLYSQEELFLDFLKTKCISSELKQLLTAGTVKKLEKLLQWDYSKFRDIFYRLNIKTLVLGDKNYPEKLAKIDNPPVVLYGRGDLDLLQRPAIGLVGARKHTAYGKRSAETIVTELATNDICTVSGLALGIDTICHRASLRQGGPTIAVLGNGIDKCYPASNRKTWKEIINTGLVLSEYPPGTPPKPFRFPERNRIIAGLATALIVVEARERSGSLITARLAASFGREVFAIPGNIDSIYSKGTNALIRDGAFILLEAEDIFDLCPEFKKKSLAQKEKTFEDLSTEELEIYKAIEDGLFHIDQLALKLSFDLPFILQALTMLELKGYITNTGTDTYMIL